MKALVFQGVDRPPAERLVLKEVEEPRLQSPSDVMIAVTLAGLSLSDVAVYHGLQAALPGVILGREIVGQVLETGAQVDREHVSRGDQVVVDPLVTCGDLWPPGRRAMMRKQFCAFCQIPLEDQCVALRRGSQIGLFVHGGFAPMLVAPQGAVHRLDPPLEPQLAVLIEPLSAVEKAVAESSLRLGESVLVLGGEAAGVLFALRARDVGCRVALNEPDPSRAQADRGFLERPQWVVSVRSTNPSPTERLKEDVLGLERELERVGFPGKPDVVVDATGHLADRAFYGSRPGGRSVLLGMDERAPFPYIRSYDVTRLSKKIIGSCSGKGHVARAIQSVREGMPGMGRFAESPIPLGDVLARGFPCLGLDPGTGSPQPVTALRILVKP